MFAYAYSPLLPAGTLGISVYSYVSSGGAKAGGAPVYNPSGTIYISWVEFRFPLIPAKKVSGEGGIKIGGSQAPGFTLSREASGGIVLDGTATTNSKQILVGGAALTAFISYGSLLPVSDNSAGSWVAYPNGSLSSCVDDTPLIDLSDYIYTKTTGSSCSLKLGAPEQSPASMDNHKIVYIVRGRGGSCTIRVKENTTLIASWTDNNLPLEDVTLEHTLTSQEVSNISNWNNLYIELEAA
jgi:hypothetical protein